MVKPMMWTIQAFVARPFSKVFLWAASLCQEKIYLNRCFVNPIVREAPTPSSAAFDMPFI